SVPTSTPGASADASGNGVHCTWINVASEPVGPGTSGVAGSPSSSGARALTNVSTGRSATPADQHRWPWSGQTAKTMTADARGRAYVLVSSPYARASSYIAVMDLATGTVLRHLCVAEQGESVLALRATPDGEMIYASVWRWPGYPQMVDHAGTSGRLLAISTQTGHTVARASLPDETAVVEISLAAPPAGSRLVGDPGALALYAITSTPGPKKDEMLYPTHSTRYTLTAFDSDHLGAITFWDLEHQPSGIVVTPNGQRAYLLHGATSWAPWSRTLTSLDLTSGGVAQAWPLPPGCYNIAYSAIGKLYVTDTLEDRLWRVNTATDTFLGSIPMPGAPVAVAARPL
ncbi:MAG TPA: hypothetical protein VGW38_01795, partial [Chloroflexota bacterium]|nr:hypothetical protein [Chloroflexota bacterium]